MSRFFRISVFVRSITSNKSDRRVILSALLKLMRSRIYCLIFFAHILVYVPPYSPKLILWRVIARLYLNFSIPSSRPSFLTSFISSITNTQAYNLSLTSISSGRTGLKHRIPSSGNIITTLSSHNPSRVLLFHHHDDDGYMPLTWLNFLNLAQQSNWQVIVTTSFLRIDLSAYLSNCGVLVVKRFNIGLCLGAYRDISELIDLSGLSKSISSFVLMNDSCLLVRSPQSLLDHLESFHHQYSDVSPTLAGLTDSFERSEYHLQSFFLYANNALLSHKAWSRFWLNFQINCSKDQLIASGEIGLSQNLLSNGVSLRTYYPLVDSLVSNSVFADELVQNNVFYLNDINPSLFLWRSLLNDGFPLFKKSLLFNRDHSHGSALILSDISKFVPSEVIKPLTEDIHQLLLSRYRFSDLP